jgi:hypothetical protein
MNQPTFLLLQTAAETERVLSVWADQLSNDQFFELGSDPRLIDLMERELEKLSERVVQMGKHVKLGQTPVRQANSYYAVQGELKKATSLVSEIRRKNHGSVRYTAHFLQQLESCQQTLREMMSLLQPSISSTLH